jgi:hypothetical protein
VEGRTRMLGLTVPAKLLSCAGATRSEQERALAANGNGKAGSTATGRDKKHTSPAGRNSCYQVSLNAVLSPSFQPSPQLSEEVIMRPNGFITLRSAGIQAKDGGQSDSSVLASVCSARSSREGCSCMDNRQLGDFRVDRILANDKAQKQDPRKHSGFAMHLQTGLPIVAAFT